MYLIKQDLSRRRKPHMTLQDFSKLNKHEIEFIERCAHLKHAAKQNNDMTVFEYIKELERNLEFLLCKLSSETFWELFPKILGIDAKLTLLENFLYSDLTTSINSTSLITLVEQDYKTINQENYDYTVNDTVPASFIFCVD